MHGQDDFESVSDRCIPVEREQSASARYKNSGFHKRPVPQIELYDDEDMLVNIGANDFAITAHAFYTAILKLDNTVALS